MAQKKQITPAEQWLVLMLPIVSILGLTYVSSLLKKQQGGTKGLGCGCGCNGAPGGCGGYA